VKLSSQIDFLALWCANLNAQRKFFEHVLGCSTQHEGTGVVVLDRGGTALVLHEAEGRTKHLAGSLQIGFYVESLDQWYDHLIEAGAEVWRSDVDLGDGRKLIAVKTPGGQFLALAGK
jgi:catechol-2,3-dioxygenase